MVYQAIMAGYRLFDGAAGYANEKEVGQGIKKAIDDGIVKREELFITTKLWNSEHRKEHVRPAFEKSLKDLGLDYIDLYLQHFPISLEHVGLDKLPSWKQDDGKVYEIKLPFEETWSEMEQIVKDGKARNIGVSNFTIPQLQELLGKATIKPAVLQIEHHPYLVQQDLVKFAQSHNMAVTAYSSFGGASYVELGIEKKEVPPLLDNPVITEIAAKHRKTSAQVLLRWATQRGIATIPKSNNPHRLAENIDIFSFALTPMDLIAITDLDKGLRFNDPKDEDPKLAWLFNSA